MKQLLFVSFTFLFLVCFSNSSASLYLFLLFWRANQLNSKNRRRFVSLVGHLWYFMGVSCKVISVENRSPFCPYETSQHCFAAEKVGDAAAVAPSSFLTTAILGTNAHLF